MTTNALKALTLTLKVKMFDFERRHQSGCSWLVVLLLIGFCFGTDFIRVSLLVIFLSFFMGFALAQCLLSSLASSGSSAALSRLIFAPFKRFLQIYF